MNFIDIFRKSILSLKLPFLASFLQNFSTVCTHMLSKFFKQSAQKWLIFPTKANFERSLILIGFFCSGKSTVGRMLCDDEHWQLVDTDLEIEKRYQKKVYEVFSDIGEEAFRRLENEIVEDLQGKKGLVISTGGGTILLEETRRMLKGMGKVIYLKASKETLLERMHKRRVPEFLQGRDFNQLADYRFPIYERLADIVIETDGLTVEEITEKCKMQIAKCKVTLPH